MTEKISEVDILTIKKYQRHAINTIVHTTINLYQSGDPSGTVKANKLVKKTNTLGLLKSTNNPVLKAFFLEIVCNCTDFIYSKCLKNLVII